MLETEYKVMARTKRIRLQKGKGIKKDGVYMHSGGAASFDSLPPGPDANDIAKDVHEVLPKLTKKGTIFRASQATVEQRAREFAILIDALFDEGLPTLIRELRENRIIRDFFGYWRRDLDHDRKANEVEARSRRASRASITSSAFSMYFSSSHISLQHPNPFADIPPSPSLPDNIKRDSKGKGKFVEQYISKTASFSSSSSSSSRGDPQTPASAPAGLSFTVSENGALIPTSPVSDDESYLRSLNGTRTTSLNSPPRSRKSKSDRAFSSHGLDSASESEDNAIVFVPEGPWSESLNSDVHRRHNLEVLPEEQELVPGVSDLSLSRPGGLPPPARRPRNYSCPDPHNRNGLVFVTPFEAAKTSLETQEDAIDPGFLSDRPGPDTPKTTSSSSKHTSTALSSFSGEFSRRSSWRTSVDSVTSAPAHEAVHNTSVDLDDILCGSLPPSSSPLVAGGADTMYKRRMSIMTMNSLVTNASVDAVLPRRPLSPISQGASVRRSVSTGSRYSRQSIQASPTVPTDEVYYENDEIMEDELLDAYFYGKFEMLHVLFYSADAPIDPGLRASGVPSVTSSEMHSQDHASVLLTRFPQPPQSAPATRLSEAPSTPSSPGPSILSLNSVIPSSPTIPSDAITIKAVRQESIVLIRASLSTPLPDLRLKIREKFASQEGVQLTDNFTIGFNPSVTAADDRSKTVPAKGRPRSQSTSALGHIGSQPRLRFLIYEEDWMQATASSPGKLTLHIFDRF
jgi:hypothetical protein